VGADLSLMICTCRTSPLSPKLTRQNKPRSSDLSKSGRPEPRLDEHNRRWAQRATATGPG
jgi:hypothetical protein